MSLYLKTNIMDIFATETYNQTIANEKIAANELINDVLEYIHHHFAESITLKALANQFHYSPSHLCREFKKALGCSFTIYLRRVRMEYAISLLKTGNYSIAEIAAKSGYSAHSFYPIFKAYTGSTPAVYTKSNDCYADG